MAQEFELRVIEMYNNFIKPFTEISKCFLELEDDGEEPKEDFEIVDLD